MRYAPQQTFTFYDANREFERIKQSLETLYNGELETVTQEITRPRDGQLIYTDATGWDPGQGEGVYVYYAGLWNRLLGMPTTGLWGDYLTGAFGVDRTGANAPSMVTFIGDIDFPAFIGTGATLNEVFFELHILHDIDISATPTLHIHWSHIAATASVTGTVQWLVDYSIAKGYGAGSFSSVATLTADVAVVATQRGHFITNDDLMPIPVTNIEPDSKLIGRLYRNPAGAGDTFPEYAFFMGIDMHFKLKDIGTLERNRPFAGY